jgi:uncharacterized iron-regulated membrane protein
MGWRTFRNALQKVHLWAGLFLMVPIVLIGISGSVIVVLENIPDLVLPAAAPNSSFPPYAEQGPMS